MRTTPKKGDESLVEFVYMPIVASSAVIVKMPFRSIDIVSSSFSRAKVFFLQF